MMTTKQYEFCEDIWREIKSYIFVPRIRGDKCDECDEKWTKRFAIRETDVWWEGKQVKEYEKNNSDIYRYINKSYCVPITHGDYPAEVNIGTKNQVKLNHYCDKCWAENTIYEIGFIRCNFKNRFLNVVENNKKNQELVDKIFWRDENWLIKKHRLIETRNLQATAILIIEAMIKDYNKIVKEEFANTLKEHKKNLEKAKWKATQIFWGKMEVETFNRDLIKRFEKGEVKYPEFVKLFKK